MMTTLLRRSTARASATSCRSPALSDPVWLIGVSIVTAAVFVFPPGPLSTDERWQRSRTSQHSASVCSENGSRLLRIVPEKSDTSWLTIVCGGR